MKKKVVFISHPISGDVDGNVQHLIKVLTKINLDFPDVVPVAPYLTDVLSLDDNVAAQRKRGIDNCNELIDRGLFDEIWLTGDNISFGMSDEIKKFVLLGKPVINFIGKFKFEKQENVFEQEPLICNWCGSELSNDDIKFYGVTREEMLDGDPDYIACKDCCDTAQRSIVGTPI